MVKKVFWIIALLLAILSVPPSLSFFVYKEIGKRTHAEIHGQFRPVLFARAFRLNDASVKWADKVELKSGDLDVRYSLTSLFQGLGFRVKISGADLPVTLLGGLADLSPEKNIVVQDFYVDVTINKQGLQEIHMIRAKAPEMHFQFGLAE